MGIFYAGLILIAGLLFGVGYLLFKKRKDPQLVYWDDWIKLHWKKFLIVLMISLGTYTLICIKPLYHTTKCYFYGKTYKTYTEYSWILGECLYKGKTGAMLPLQITRDNPDGDVEE